MANRQSVFGERMGFGMGFSLCAEAVIKKKIPRTLRSSRENPGAAIQIRTGDLILTKDVLYLLSHSSKFNKIYLLEYYILIICYCQFIFK